MDYVKKTFDKGGIQEAHCNVGVNYAFKSLTKSDELSGKKANQMGRYLAKSDNFKPVDIKDAQNLANSGEIVIASYINPNKDSKGNENSGHVALVVPGEASQQGSWNEKPASEYGGLPNLMDTGEGMRAESQRASLSFGSKKHDEVIFYQYTGASVDPDESTTTLNSTNRTSIGSAKTSSVLKMSKYPIVQTGGDILDLIGY